MHKHGMVNKLYERLVILFLFRKSVEWVFSEATMRSVILVTETDEYNTNISDHMQKDIAYVFHSKSYPICAQCTYTAIAML